MAERARVKQVETPAAEQSPAGGHEMGDHTLQDCQRLMAGLWDYFDSSIRLEAVARWSPEQRLEVAAWLEQFDADDPPQEPADPPQWLMRVHQLVMVLEPYDSSVEEWQILARDGASDGTILSMVATMLNVLPGIDTVGTDWGPVCWSIDEERNPSIWFGEEVPPRRKADLEGASLVAAVRGLYGVQAPAPPAADVPGGRSTSAGGNGSGKRRSKSGPKLSRVGRETGLPLTLEIDPGLIDRFPGNPRDELEFDEAELLDLGEDLKRRQVQPCTVRRFGERYQLIAGERRWRAAKLVSLPALRCEVVDVSDAEAVWMCGVENEKRSEWSPIARARWYRNVREAEGISVEELAERVGVSQGHVSSTINLLDLPDEWQRRIISREMSPTCVRPLIPWAKKRPQVLEQVATELKLPGSKAKQPREPKDKVTVRQMEEAVRNSLRKCTRGMNPEDWRENQKPLFSITKQRRQLLDVEKLKLSQWEPPVNRAWNTAEWDRLQKEAKKKRKEKGEDDRPAASSSRGYAIGDQTHEYRVNEWLSDWAGKLIGERLGDNRELALQLLLATGTLYLVDQSFDGAKWQQLREFTPEDFFARLPDACREALSEEVWVGSRLCEEGLAADVAGELGIDLNAEFSPDASLLGFFCTDDLRKFAGVGKAEKELEKPALIEHLLANWKPGWMPTQIRKQLGLKNAPQEKAGTKAARRKKAAAQASGN